MIKIKEGSLYLVTGGSGFLGKELCKEIAAKGGRVRLMARDEGKLIDVKQELPQAEIFPGDISDKFEVVQAMRGVSGVFHLAASKHVGLAETFVRENVKSNVIGSLNILEQSLEQPLEFVLLVSTDKAAQVAGVYGATKFLMERLAGQYEALNPNCKYRIVRYGNVLYSTGSVLCKWRDLLIAGKPIIVTDPAATRFFWTVQEAISLIFGCLENSINSRPYCPDMKAMLIEDLLKAMMLKYSPKKAVRIQTIGLQPGENLHEKVLEEGPYSNEAPRYTVEEILPLI